MQQRHVLLFFGYRLHIGNSPSLSQLDTALFLGQQNDGVVPVPSQEGGLPDIFFTVYGFNNHLQETGSNTIGTDVARLLTGPLSNFASGFPAISTASSWIAARTQIPTDSPVTAPFVTISSLVDGQVFHTGDTIQVTVVPNAGTTLSQVLIEAGNSPRDLGSALVTQAPYSASFTVTANALGTVPITVTAKDNAGNVCTVTETVLVQTNATLNSMSIFADLAAPSGAALLTSQGSTNSLTVTGTFSDATQSDVTAAVLGTTYASSAPTIATVSADGVLTALAEGSATITVTNGSVVATKNVIVQLGTPSILSTAPPSAAPGTTIVLTLTGSDLGGASQVGFLKNGAADPNITVTNVSTDIPGTKLTATITLGPGALPGLHTIVVTTPGGQSDQLAAADAAGFTVVSPANTHVLWNNADGTASIWNYNPTAGTFAYKNYGPYPGWTAKAIADGGTDGTMRVLWTNTLGKASIWSLDNNTGKFVSHDFGPYNGWTATAISVGADGTTHVAWVDFSGTLSLWNYDAISGGFSYKNYGPYAGWTAKTIADAPDGSMRVLWATALGQASLWSLNNNTGQFVSHNFGPYTGWTATALSVGADGTTHVAWDDFYGTLSLWNYDAVSGAHTYKNYGPYAGWMAKAIADGADGKQRELWVNKDGTLSMGSLDTASGIYGYHNFGPYTGWTATALSVGH